MYYTFILFITLLVPMLNAQTYSNVRAEQDGLLISISYDMDGKLFRGDKVGLVFSLDDGKNYSIVDDAEGDLGANVLPGKGNEVNWLLIDKDFILVKLLTSALLLFQRVWFMLMAVNLPAVASEIMKNLLMLLN